MRYGYDYGWRILNAADYGAYTMRKRFFGIFAKRNLPIVWPEPSHSKTGGNDIFGGLDKWKPVKDVLDFSDEGNSIFNRKKNLSPKTLERIYAGLIRFVAGGKESFLTKYNSVNENACKDVVSSRNKLCPTVVSQSISCSKSVHFLAKHFSGHPESKVSSVDNTAGTITTIDHHSLIKAEFLSAHYGNGNNYNVNGPCPTITTKDKFSVVRPEFIINNYSGGGQLSSFSNPCPAIMTNPKQNVIACEWYLMNPQFSSVGGSVEKPCFTLIANMNKRPPYLVVTKSGQMAIEIYETDSEPMRKIKEFMALYGIVDIKMRMLKIIELKRIMGFPKDYTLIGTQAEQKKFIGNAVEVNMAKSLCQSLSQSLWQQVAAV